MPSSFSSDPDERRAAYRQQAELGAQISIQREQQEQNRRAREEEREYKLLLKQKKEQEYEQEQARRRAEQIAEDERKEAQKREKRRLELERELKSIDSNYTPSRTAKSTNKDSSEKHPLASEAFGLIGGILGGSISCYQTWHDKDCIGYTLIGAVCGGLIGYWIKAILLLALVVAAFYIYKWYKTTFP